MHNFEYHSNVYSSRQIVTEDFYDFICSVRASLLGNILRPIYEIATSPYDAKPYNISIGKTFNDCTSCLPFDTVNLLYDVPASHHCDLREYFKEKDQVFSSLLMKRGRQKWLFYLPTSYVVPPATQNFFFIKLDFCRNDLKIFIDP